MPAQVARSVGFDSGFKDPVADLVSGGPVPRFGAAKRLLARAGAQRPLLGQPGEPVRHHLLLHQRDGRGGERPQRRRGRLRHRAGGARHFQTTTGGLGTFRPGGGQQPVRRPRHERGDWPAVEPAPAAGHHDVARPRQHGHPIALAIRVGGDAGRKPRVPPGQPRLYRQRGQL